jgi:molecular chaperone DnaK
VAFDIDANGILHVSAKDQGTGKEQKIRIEASSGLSDEEIERMKKEAEANAEADKAEKERIEKINSAASMIFQTEKQLKEYDEKLSEGTKKPIEEALERLREAHKSEDPAAIDSAMEGINKAWEGAAQEMYAASGGAQQDPGDAGAQAGPEADAAAGSDADVSDVEYEEVDDKDSK